MTVWRPRSSIRVIVIGLVWRGADLLAAEVHDDAGNIKGVRPLGGEVEFGETREKALAREFQEELRSGITITGPWIALENIFHHEDAVGHEIVFAADIRLHDERLYAQDEIGFTEQHLATCKARWFGPDALPQGVALFPDGLAPLLQREA